MVDIFPKANKKVISVKEAFKNIKNLDKDLKEVNISKFAIYNELIRLKPGEKSNKYFNLIKQNPNKPSAVISKTNSHLSAASVCHWDNRKFTINELKQVFSFNSDFKFNKEGGYLECANVLGNCVPPKFMEAIARQIILYLKAMGINQKKYTVISTFAGCGGSSLGYKWAGFKELLAIDFDKNAVETFKLNFDVPIWERDIKTVTAKEILDFCKIEVGELDVLDGSPPCQGFSTAGKRIVSDERNDLFLEYVRLIDRLQPKVFVMENVSGMVKGKMKGKFIEIMKTLKSLNYEVKCKLMNAKYYNVPQSRERLIWIGVRRDIEIEGSFPGRSKKLIIVKEVFKNIDGENDAPKLSALYKKYWRNAKQGENIGKYNCAKKLKITRVADTITKSDGYGGLYHPTECRPLSSIERKKLASFPDNFNFINWKSCTQQIGNSVPPKFMQAIAENIKVNILDKYYE